MKKYLPILLILTLALALRLIGSQSRSIWYDEAFSILLAEKGPATILSGTLTADANSSAAEEHPPAYYFILWGWMQVFGTSLLSIRLLSILFSLGTIICIYYITHHLFNEQTARVAAIFAAILPFQIHYGVEVRMYILLAFWLMLATLAYLKRWWIVFSLTAALAQYTHNLAAIYLIPLALTPLFQRDWKTLRTLTLAGFGSIILYFPWLIQLPSQISKVTSSFWVEKPGFEKIFTLTLMYLPHLPLPNSMLPFGLLFAVLVIVLAAFQTNRALRDKSESAPSGFWLTYLSFAPPLLLWLVSQIYPIYVERALLPAHSIFCIWLAWAFMQTKLPRLVQTFAFIFVLTSGGMGIYQHITYKDFPYVSPNLTESIQSRLEAGDMVIHSSKLSYLPAFYYTPSLPQGFILDPVNSSIDTLSPATRRILDLSSYTDVKEATANADRIWFIIYQTSIDEYDDAGQIQPQLEYLNKNFHLEGVEDWNNLRLYLYEQEKP